MLGKVDLSKKSHQELKQSTGQAGDTLGRTVFQESAVGEGVQWEITRKAGWGQGPEGTGYLAKECTLYPRCRLGYGEVAVRKMTLAADRLGRNGEWEAS